jgi:hypothetical protein
MEIIREKLKVLFSMGFLYELIRYSFGSFRKKNLS